MKEEFYRSYRTFEMYPVTIHCNGMKCGNATILSAGFASFGGDVNKVSAFITMKNGTPELAKRLLEFLDENGNFVRLSTEAEMLYGPYKY